MANIRCTTMKDGSMYHTFMVGDKMHVLGVVRSPAQAEAGCRVNMLQSRSASVSSPWGLIR